MIDVTLGQLENAVTRQVTLYESYFAQVDNLERRAGILAEEVETIRLASELLLAVGSDHQQSVIEFMNGLISKGLQDVFGLTYEIAFRETTSRNQRVIDMVLVRGGHEDDIPDGVGGGVVEVVAVLVQLALVYLLRGTVAQVVVLDESLSHLATVYVPRAANMLRAVSMQLGIQLIMITHQDDFREAADRVYELSEGPDGTNVRRDNPYA